MQNEIEMNILGFSHEGVNLEIAKIETSKLRSDRIYSKVSFIVHVGENYRYK